ncbi:hypothetical protein B0H14DRAFT_2601595 [Mycena olivaceomarginata]|nr:hypothetical protein B0H14DRAFT_2601595 [Mycena olivaceomarginata]
MHNPGHLHRVELMAHPAHTQVSKISGNTLLKRATAIGSCSAGSSAAVAETTAFSYTFGAAESIGISWGETMVYFVLLNHTFSKNEVSKLQLIVVLSTAFSDSLNGMISETFTVIVDDTNSPNSTHAGTLCIAAQSGLLSWPYSGSAPLYFDLYPPQVSRTQLRMCRPTNREVRAVSKQMQLIPKAHQVTGRPVFGLQEIFNAISTLIMVLAMLGSLAAPTRTVVSLPAPESTTSTGDATSCVMVQMTASRAWVLCAAVSDQEEDAHRQAQVIARKEGRKEGRKGCVNREPAGISNIRLLKALNEGALSDAQLSSEFVKITGLCKAYYRELRRGPQTTEKLQSTAYDGRNYGNYGRTAATTAKIRLTQNSRNSESIGRSLNRAQSGKNIRSPQL